LNNHVAPIPLENLAVAVLPVMVVMVLVHRWGLGVWTPLYATARMLVQLVAVGYVLKFLFLTDRPLVVVATLAAMLAIAGWIALRPVKRKSLQKYRRSVAAIAIGGGGTLALTTRGVLELDPWYLAQKLIPLAGMSFTAAMNCVSLAAERFESETDSGAEYATARERAMKAALITVTNSLLAVGLVSLPGFMTGQILADVEPLIAARYQIMIMCMMFGAGGIAAAVYLMQMRPIDVTDPTTRA
jgi:putative ABC transport system permease protein